MSAGDWVDWLMVDPDFDKRTKDRFKGVSALYTPSSWWLWHNLGEASNGKEFYERILKAPQREVYE